MKLLATREGREEMGMCLLEGTHLLEEAVKVNRLPNEIVATSSWLADHTQLLESIPKKILIHEVTYAVLKAAITTVNPDGVAAFLCLKGLPKPGIDVDFVLALDRLQDPGNLGTLLRTALAADVDVVWLASGVDPLNQKALRASAGAILRLPYERFGASEDQAVKMMIEKLEIAADEGHQVVATLLPTDISDRPVLPYWELDWTQPTVLILGNEGSGIHPALLACCTHGITLPHSTSVESLNVASVAVPLLMERRRSTMTSEIHSFQ